jgi:hypothetical protein
MMAQMLLTFTDFNTWAVIPENYIYTGTHDDHKNICRNKFNFFYFHEIHDGKKIDF